MSGERAKGRSLDEIREHFTRAATAPKPELVATVAASPEEVELAELRLRLHEYETAVARLISKVPLAMLPPVASVGVRGILNSVADLLVLNAMPDSVVRFHQLLEASSAVVDRHRQIVSSPSRAGAPKVPRGLTTVIGLLEGAAKDAVSLVGKEASVVKGGDPIPDFTPIAPGTFDPKRDAAKIFKMFGDGSMMVLLPGLLRMLSESTIDDVACRVAVMVPFSPADVRNAVDLCRHNNSPVRLFPGGGTSIVHSSIPPDDAVDLLAPPIHAGCRSVVDVTFTKEVGTRKIRRLPY